MTHEELRKEAEKLYYEIGEDSPFCAGIKARQLIASKIDQCEDRDEHLGILKWEEYKPYAPMTRKEYEELLKKAKEDYEYRVAYINHQWEERGKYSPDYHKI